MVLGPAASVVVASAKASIRCRGWPYPPSCGASRHLHALELGNGDRHDTQGRKFESHHVDRACSAGAASVAVAGIGGFLGRRTGPDLPPLDRVQVAYA